MRLVTCEGSDENGDWSSKMVSMMYLFRFKKSDPVREWAPSS